MHHEQWQARFQQAMDDDFNTPKALAVLFDLTRFINQTLVSDPEEAKALATTLKQLGNLLGLFYREPYDWLQNNPLWDQSQLDVISARVKEREEARQNQEWARADALRQWLEEQGVELEDKGGKTHWKVR